MEEELEWAQSFYLQAINYLVEKGFQLLGALVIVLLGIWIAKKVSNAIESWLVKSNVDVTLSSFIASTVKILVIVFISIMALKKIEVEVTPFIAAIGALSLGAGLALQGLLSNYGAGLAIILTRPFVVGDTISVQGVTGIVKEVKLACTILTNEDNVRITIPNKHIVGEIIHNSAANTVIEGTIDVAYSSDIDKAIMLIADACTTVSGVSDEKSPQVGIEAFAASGVSIAYRYWVSSELKFQISMQVNSAVFKALNDNDIAIPFPQREVRLLQDTP